MTDLDEFVNLPDTSRKYRKFRHYRQKAIYVCTICNTYQFPTKEVNLRCRKCEAPLIESLEKIYALQREIKWYDGDDEEVTKVRERIQLVRAMKKEFAGLERERKIIKKKEGKPIARRDSSAAKQILIFNLTIPVAMKPPNGFKGNIEVPRDQLKAFEKKCEKMKAHYYLVATKTEWEAMEDIRRAMIEASK